MSLDYEIEEDGTLWDWAAVGQAGRKVEPSPTYQGVGVEDAILDVELMMGHGSIGEPLGGASVGHRPASLLE